MKKTWCTYMVILVCCLHAGYACLPKRPGNFCPCETNEDCQLFRANTLSYKLFEGKAKCDTEAKKCVNVYNEGGCEVTNFLAKQKSIYQAVEALQSRLNAVESDPQFKNEAYKRSCLTENDRFCTHYTRKTIYRNTTLKILVQNWLSAQMSAQLVQLILVEVLKIPTVLVHVIEEDGKADDVVHTKGFYEEYLGKALHTDAPKAYNLKTVEKCNNSTNSQAGVCADMMMEVWRTIDSQIGNGKYSNTRKVLYGAQGQIGLYVPRWVVDENPDLASYRGFKSGDIQRKLRNKNLFPLPVSWSDYCTNYVGQQGVGYINVTRICPIPDRFQANHNHSYYFQDAAGKVFYGGYFESGNNSSAGYLSTIDYCDWGEYSKFMFEKNGLLIDYGGPGHNRKGYQISNMYEIPRAAKENQVGFIMFWWQPEVLPVDLQVNDKRYEMIRIGFPPNNPLCRNDRNQAYSDNLCEAEKNVNSSRYDNAGCDWAADPLRKVVSERMVNKSKDLDVEIVHQMQADLKNPIYRLMQGFKVSNGLLDLLFKAYLELKKDVIYHKDFDQIEQHMINHAVCKVARATDATKGEMIHIEDMWEQTLAEIPSRYILPDVKLFRQRRDFLSILFLVCQILAAITFAFCIAMAALVWKHKDKHSIKRAQPSYTMVILSGCALIFIHVFLSLIEPDANNEVAGSAHCIASRFCRHIGIFATIVPLFVILNTITNILNRSNKRFSKKRGQRAAKAMLFKTVISLCFITAYCIAWTLVDSVQLVPRFKPVQMYSAVLNGENEQFLVRTECRAHEGDDTFSIILDIIEAMFLVWGIVSAIRNGGVKKEYNTSKPVAFAMYNAGVTMLIPVLVNSELIRFRDGSAIVLINAIAIWWIFSVLIVFYYFPKIVFLIADTVKSIKRLCRRLVGISYSDRRNETSLDTVQVVSTDNVTVNADFDANRVNQNPMKK